MQTLNNDPIVRPSDLEKELSASKTSIWRWTRDGVLPKPVKIGNRNTGWPRSVINAWKAEQGWPVLPADAEVARDE